MNQREQFILYLKHIYNREGIPETPLEVAQRMVDLTRRMGRTRTLIEALPKDGKAIVLVWNRDMAGHIKAMCRDLYGQDLQVQNLIFLTYEEWTKNGNRTRGLPPMPAFVDNHVYDMLALDLAQCFYNEFSWDGKAVKPYSNHDETPCENSTPASIDTSEKSSSKSRKKSKKTPTVGG